MPFFSVIIPTYNRAQSVDRAIASVLSQTFTDYECIVVDDGSTDNTDEVLSRYATNVKYVRIQHAGVSKARNVGISLARGEWIAFLDSDDLWDPQKLHIQFNYIKNNPHVLIHQTDEVWIRNGRRVNPLKKHTKKEGFIFEESLQLCLISPSAVVLHRSVFDEVGLFDEILPVCEDYDLWLRVSWRYYVGLIEKKCIVKYGGHNDQLSKRYWGMDRFRVYAICKVLSEYGDELPPHYYAKAVDVALQKCRILYNGANKRGNNDLLEKVARVQKWLIDDRKSKTAYRCLVEE